MPKPQTEAATLQTCLKLLEVFGDSGRIVWELGKFYRTRKKEPFSIKKQIIYLKQSIRCLKRRVDENRSFEEKMGEPLWHTLPVDFQTFVDSPEMMNKNGVLWPRVLMHGLELNSGDFTECILTGGIGVAKSTLAIYTQAYQTYILSCMANPHEAFDLDPSSEILIVFQSINKSVAKDVDYTRLRDMIEGAPYFQTNFMFDKNRESEMRFPRRIGIKPVAGSDTGAIGQNVIGGILDEVNFMAVVENSKQASGGDGGTYDQATQNYNSIASRRESRFMQLGQLPGMLCLVSSRNYPGQFTDKKEAEAKTNPRIYVYDKRIWDIRPERFCGEWFPVFAGDPTRKPRIMDPDESVSKADEHLVIQIPVEYRHRFEADLITALREVAGVATQAMHPYMMNTDAISGAFGRVPSVLSREDCDFKHTRVAIYPRRFVNLQASRFVHIDPSKTRDSTGVSVAHCPGFVEVDRGDVFEMLPVIQFDLMLEIKPPKGGEIEFANVRRLIYALKQQGLPIKWVSSDTFQSTDNLQILRQQGYQTGVISMDQDTTAYDTTRLAIYDGRLLAPAHPLAQAEMTRLEFDAEKQKIDHPPNFSKDVADSMAGCAYGLTQRREIWNMYGVRPNTTRKKTEAEMHRPPRDPIEDAIRRGMMVRA